MFIFIKILKFKMEIQAMNLRNISQSNFNLAQYSITEIQNSFY